MVWKLEIWAQAGINSALSENRGTFILPFFSLLDHIAEVVCSQTLCEVWGLSQQRSGFCGNRCSCWSLVWFRSTDRFLVFHLWFARTAVPTAWCTDWMQREGISCNSLQRFCLQVAGICSWPVYLAQMGEQRSVPLLFPWIFFWVRKLWWAWS